MKNLLQPIRILYFVPINGNAVAITLSFCLFVFLSSFAQNILAQSDTARVYFDKMGKKTDKQQSYYYRVKPDQQGLYKAFYLSNGSPYFEGKILTVHPSDESKNMYSGACTWYYKNGKPKTVRNYDAAGIEEGISNYYYDSGKIWKEIECKNGKIVNNRYKEFDEAGQISLIFEEDFNDNFNDWDLYSSDKSAAKINDGKFELTSFSKEGTSRYISIPYQSQEVVLEAIFGIEKLKSGEKAGLIFGFKDWQNYNFFSITQSSFYIGTVYEGVSQLRAEGMFSSAIKKEGDNSIKIINSGDKSIYSINGEIQYSTPKFTGFGSHIGFALSGKSTLTVEKLIFKELDYKPGGATVSNSDLTVKASGSGLIFNPDGYILTNFHVIDAANTILIELNTGGSSKTYPAKLIQKDMDNDLAILKISDASFVRLEPLAYSFKESGNVEVGASVFSIGYPLALSGMGREAKFTDGKISSKTGYNNAMNTYQTSIPVQPGNSGGPLFNDKGQLIGIINAKVFGADNVSYAIKLNYVKNLIEMLPDAIELPGNPILLNTSLEDKIKILSQYVVLIKIK